MLKKAHKATVTTKAAVKKRYRDITRTPSLPTIRTTKTVMVGIQQDHSHRSDHYPREKRRISYTSQEVPTKCV